ncbi:hypothetical protein O0I10_009520 [Lichtheimia ornata]|uniref:Uncharacterized protein n=1 Tax=Lichtheimia ornata TaxID=688661 RepID=A0AAD7XS41_9FUNG|nr:uncharacterized protein O0I10_009520 [Lichtheimia ornata]KAJ8654799.1 hypothetical protein O0I10_009520 [Lichtheimia ornata]
MYFPLKRKEYGELRPGKFIRAEASKRAYSIQLSPCKQVTRTHRGGVHSVKIEHIEQQYMLSGGADGRIHVYDLNTASDADGSIRIKSLQGVTSQNRHHYAVTTLSWFPFDTGMFISSSFDKTIRVWDTNTMTPACTFHMDSRIYCQAISPIASHCLVASAADEPRIRLCDLKSGADTHSLGGHVGSILSVAWSPREEHVLYSGGSDGTIRVWDIRRAAACLRLLDQHNGDASPLADTNVAHGGGVNGFAFTGNGHYLVSLGLDEKIRLWDTFTLNNTLVNYGSLWRNQFRFYLQASISDTNVWPPLLYVPSDDHQVLVYELHSGILLRRLRGAYGRVTCTEYRPGYQELYVGSNDSEVLVWEPINENDQEPIDNSMGTFQDTWSESEDEEQ